MNAEDRSFARIMAEEIPSPDKTLADVIARDGYTGILKSLLPDEELDRIFLLDRLQVICLCGRPGSGKRTLALAYAGSAARRGWRIVRGTCSGFCEEKAAAENQMREMLQEASAQSSVLILEMRGDIRLWETFSACRSVLSSDAPLHILLVEDDESLLGSFWLRDMTVLRITPPECAARAVFFEEDTNRLMRRTDAQGRKVPSYHWLAEETEELTYPELQLVIRLIRLQMKRRAQRELAGDAERLREEIKKGLFFYTEDMFRETVKTVRACRYGGHLIKPAAAGQPAGFADEKTQQAPGGEASAHGKEDPIHKLLSEEELTEDEEAWNSVLARLHIPPKPEA